LGAMSAAPKTFNALETGFDLTLPGTPTYGTQARATLAPGLMGLWSGNTFRDDRLKYTGASNDRDPILVGVGGTTPTNTASGYSLLDVNLDGLIKYTGANNDRDPILVNIGGTIPTAVRHEQMP
jgi:hypothetical protein